MSTHHPRSMSKWPHWLQCAHWVGDEAETEASKAGTQAHESFAKQINDYQFGGKKDFTEDGAGWAAQTVVNMAVGKTCKVHVEEEVKYLDTDYPSSGNGEFISGTCDAWFLADNGMVYVFDFKNGSPSELDYMPQVFGYASAIIQRLNEEGADDVKCAKCHILYGATKQTYSVLVDKADLAKNTAECLHTYANKSKMFSTPCVSCAYCANRLNCPTLSRDVVTVGSEDAENMLACLSDAKQYQLLAAVKGFCERRLNELKDLAVLNGGLDDGEVKYEVKRNRHGSVIRTDIQRLYGEAISRGVDISEGQMMEACSLSKDSFVKLCKEHNDIANLKVKDMEELYESVSIYGAPSVRLVKAK